VSGNVHRYAVDLAWSGSTGAGYTAYRRAHTVTVAAAGRGLELTADPAFRGDPALINPEQLLLAAAASCQLLSFLAVAARARVDVRGYTDSAEAVMPEDERPIRITRIVLRPRITVAPGPTEARLRHLVVVAHRECFIANSLSSEIVVEPVLVWA
jgi:organic hydroperoxide reductase OsmC/OhrA